MRVGTIVRKRDGFPQNQGNGAIGTPGPAELPNVHRPTLAGFGYEWRIYDQAALPEPEALDLFHQYFAVFPWERLPPDAVGFDVGCGSGRWARLVAPRVGRLFCFDPSAAALEVARRNLAGQGNVELVLASADSLPLPDDSADFGYALGVLHHVPDTASALSACARKLKPGAPFLLYLYYALDNRPAWYRGLWRAQDVVRRVIARTPLPLRRTTAEIIACTVYLPLARVALLAERLGVPIHHFPLSCYRARSYYTMRTDAFDRFATRLEKRFTAREIESLMCRAGLTDIRFHSGTPFWCVVGLRAAGPSPGGANSPTPVSQPA